MILEPAACGMAALGVRRIPVCGELRLLLRLLPGLKAALEVSGALEPELPQRCGRETRAATLVGTTMIRRLASVASGMWCEQVGSSRYSRTLRSMITGPGVQAAPGVSQMSAPQSQPQLRT